MSKYGILMLIILLVGLITVGYSTDNHSRKYYLFYGVITEGMKPNNGNSFLPEFILNTGNNDNDNREGMYDVQRYREVNIETFVSQKDKIKIGDEIVLDLFSDKSYTASISRISEYNRGNMTVTARINDFEYGYIILSNTAGRTLATIKIPEKKELYLIKSDAVTLQHYLLDIGETYNNYLEGAPAYSLPPRTSGVRQRTEERQEAPGNRNPGPDDPAILDIMIVYTPAAANWANNNGGGIENVVSVTMGLSQLAHDNSGTVAELYLVRSSLIQYTESGSSSTDLFRLTFREDWDPNNWENGPPWYMEEVHQWRDDTGADLVVLLTLVNDVGGVGWLLNNVNGSPALGFSITRVQQAARTYTAVHEIGHNMGAHHHRAQNFQPGPGLFNYSAGWRWTGTDNRRYCSVMTYESGQYFNDGQDHTRVAHFSNPRINYEGVATGHIAQGDNSRTIRETKHIVADYRQGVLYIPEIQITMNLENRVVLSWQRIHHAKSYKVYAAVSVESDWDDWEMIAAVAELFYVDEDELSRSRFYRVTASTEELEE